MKLKLQYFGHLMQKADSLEKQSYVGKDWRQKEKGVAEDEMVREHHWLSRPEFEQTPRDSGGQMEPGMVEYMESQAVRHDLATKQQLCCVTHLQSVSCDLIFWNVWTWDHLKRIHNFQPYQDKHLVVQSLSCVRLFVR